jgi:plastocyanin
MKKLLLALPALAIAMTAVFASSGQSAEAAEVSLRVRAGDGEPGYAVNMFLPEDVYLRSGDTVTWDFVWDEPHSVTFGEIAGDPSGPSHPGVAVVEHDGTEFVNSGLIFGSKAEPSSFSVKFTAEGTFEYYCFIHPLMTGTVHVQGPGIGEQDTQVAVDARGAATYTSAINALKSAAAATAAKPVAITGSGATKKYSVQVSSLTDVPQGDVMQFFPASLNIGPTDTVEFVSNVHTPHDVAFLPPGLDPSGPPPPGLEDFDPFEDSVNYSPGARVDNTKPVISPVIGLEFPAGTTASFTFAGAGTYDYVCILHASQGMVGRINVTTSGAPLPPNTGDSPMSSGPSGTSGLWLIFGAVGIAFAATGVAFATTRR